MCKGVLDLNVGTLDITHIGLESTKPSKVKQVRKNTDDLHRARQLHTAITEFLLDVDMVCVEIPVGSQSARAMASYGMSIGVLASIKVPMIQVTPSEVKIAAVGNKTATKQQMIDWAARTYPDTPWPTRTQKGVTKLLGTNEHIADALAAIHAGCRTDEFAQVRAVMKKVNA